LKLPSLDKKKKRALIALTILVFGILYAASLYKLQEKQKALLEQIDSYQKFICKGEKAVRKEKELIKYKNAIEKQILKGKSEAEITARFQNILSELINKAGVNLERIEEARIKKEKSGIDIIYSRIYITGTSSNIIKALYLIESNEAPVFFIKNLTMRKQTYFGRRKTTIKTYLTVASPIKLEEK